MQLFKSDLARNFAFGFVLGAAVIGLNMSGGLMNSLIPQAVAATVG